MTHLIYNKPFKDENQLIVFLKDKNLLINNVQKAKKILKDISYYRFKAYAHPFKNTETKCFDGSKSFEDIESLYRFDDKLRDLLFSIIGRIEIKVRSKLNYTITKYLDNPFWYLESSLFSEEHSDILHKISNSFVQSKEDYAREYQAKYINNTNGDFQHLPPFWIIAEVTMFGDITKIYKSIKKEPFQNNGTNELDKLAKEFGAYNMYELNQWLSYIQLIRNKCAHHSRVWNTNYFAIRNILSPNFGRLNIQPYNKNRIYPFFAMINIIIKNLSLDINLKKELETLMTQYPIFEEMKNSAGFPINWNMDSFWN